MTDERVQSVQAAMIKAETPKKKKKRFQVFFSKTEDFHRLMNALEVGFTIIFFFLCFIVDIHIIMCFIMISFLNK